MPFHFLAGSNFLHLIRLLWTNGISFQPLMILRAISSFLLSILLLPIGWMEYLLFSKRIRKQNLKDPLFIIGHPRSGTTFLHYLIGRDPQFGYCSIAQCFSPHTLILLGWLTRFFCKSLLPEKRQMDNLKLSPDAACEEEFAIGNLTAESMSVGYYFPQKMLSHFKNSVLLQSDQSKSKWKATWLFFLKKVAFLNKNNSLVIKSPYNIARIETILDIFPNAKFIHIYRDPFKVYSSSKHLLKKIFPDLALQEWNDEIIEDFVLNSYKMTMSTYLKQKSLLREDQLIEIKYENLVKEPIKELSSAYKQLNISNFDKAQSFIEDELQIYKNYKTNKHSLSEERQKVILKEWKEVFDHYEFNPSMAAR